MTALLQDLYQPIYLHELGGNELLQRIDRKLAVHTSQLNTLLEVVAPFYRVLEVNGSQVNPYQTDYFDTADLNSYLSHHGGRTRRFKIRHRHYTLSDVAFWEVKARYAEGKSKKMRLSGHRSEAASAAVADLIATHSPYRFSELEHSLRVGYERITLVHHYQYERVTLDTALWFESEGRRYDLPGLAIVEIKQGKHQSSPMWEALRQRHWGARSVSKYCLGMALLHPGLKQNHFKPTITKLLAIAHASPAS
ncbi:MAG: hypothetical protein C0424_05960 [Sphingobacteriaceae bacterium]|nr:hypothetical protein [Sphingobacteriaceae bacterium]